MAAPFGGAAGGDVALGLVSGSFAVVVRAARSARSNATFEGAASSVSAAVLRVSARRDVAVRAAVAALGAADLVADSDCDGAGALALGWVAAADAEVRLRGAAFAFGAGGAVSAGSAAVVVEMCAGVALDVGGAGAGADALGDAQLPRAALAALSAGALRLATAGARGAIFVHGVSTADDGARGAGVACGE